MIFIAFEFDACFMMTFTDLSLRKVHRKCICYHLNAAFKTIGGSITRIRIAKFAINAMIHHLRGVANYIWSRLDAIGKSFILQRQE